jgi:hypothetical protein
MKCFPIESLLPSTLQCFYDNNPCFDIINNIFDKTIYMNFTRLNSSEPSRFSINVTISDLLKQLFIESWSTTIDYSSYFNKCQPLSCSYTLIQRRNFLQILTTITALIGGLAKIFRFLSPLIISVFLYSIHRYRNRHLPKRIKIHQGTIEQFKYLYISLERSEIK